MNVIDIIITVLLMVGFGRGLAKGIIAELTSILALLVGIYVSIKYSHITMNFLQNYVSWDPKLMKLAAFAATFLVIVLIITLIGRLLTKLAGMIALGMVNRILGGVFGVLKMAFLLSLIIWFAGGFLFNNNILSGERIANSYLYGPVEIIAPTVLGPMIKDVSFY